MKKTFFLWFARFFMGVMMVPSFSVAETLNYDVCHLLPTDKNYFFGHQSVGNNILTGINDLCPSRHLVKTIENYENEMDGLFLHAYVGENADPISKIDNFYDLIKKHNKELSVAFLKLCYVDITSETDTDYLLKYYKDKITIINNEYPKIRIVHFTVPLMITPSSMKIKIKNILGRDIWEYEDNIKRNEYNEKLLVLYDSDQIFDLAMYESTFDEDKRVTFNSKGLSFYSLYTGYTYDGGHLNEFGRKYIASELLKFLSKD